MTIYSWVRNCSGLLCVCLMACDVQIQPPEVAKTETIIEIQAQLFSISAAFESRDVSAFKKTLAPEIVTRLKAQTADVDAELAAIIEQQRTGWLAIVGTNARVEIDRVIEGEAGDIEVFLKTAEASNKGLHFLRTVDGLRFSATENLRPSTLSLSSTAAVTTFNFHYHNNSSNSGMMVCTSPTLGSCPSIPDCAAIHALSPNENTYQSTTCTTGHWASCGVGVQNVLFQCMGDCWYQWVGDDIFKYANGVYNCGR